MAVIVYSLDHEEKDSEVIGRVVDGEVSNAELFSFYPESVWAERDEEWFTARIDGPNTIATQIDDSEVDPIEDPVRQTVEHFRQTETDGEREKLEKEDLIDIIKEWIPYEGPDGGDGWRSTVTQEVRYQDEKPEESSAPDVDEIDLDDVDQSSIFGSSMVFNVNDIHEDVQEGANVRWEDPDNDYVWDGYIEDIRDDSLTIVTDSRREVEVPAPNGNPEGAMDIKRTVYFGNGLAGSDKSWIPEDDEPNEAQLLAEGIRSAAAVDWIEDTKPLESFVASLYGDVSDARIKTALEFGIEEHPMLDIEQADDIFDAGRAHAEDVDLDAHEEISGSPTPDVNEVKIASAVRQIQKDEREESQWLPYIGPRGGTGWSNPDSDEVTYDDDPPGEVIPGADEFIEADMEEMTEALSDIIGENVAQKLVERKPDVDSLKLTIAGTDEYQEVVEYLSDEVVSETESQEIIEKYQLNDSNGRIDEMDIDPTESFGPFDEDGVSPLSIAPEMVNGAFYNVDNGHLKLEEANSPMHLIQMMEEESRTDMLSSTDVVDFLRNLEAEYGTPENPERPSVGDELLPEEMTKLHEGQRFTFAGQAYEWLDGKGGLDDGYEVETVDGTRTGILPSDGRMGNTIEVIEGPQFGDLELDGSSEEELRSSAEKYVPDYDGGEYTGLISNDYGKVGSWMEMAADNDADPELVGEILSEIMDSRTDLNHFVSRNIRDKMVDTESMGEVNLFDGRKTQDTMMKMFTSVFKQFAEEYPEAAQALGADPNPDLDQTPKDIENAVSSWSGSPKKGASELFWMAAIREGQHQNIPHDGLPKSIEDSDYSEEQIDAMVQYAEFQRDILREEFGDEIELYRGQAGSTARSYVDSKTREGEEDEKWNHMTVSSWGMIPSVASKFAFGRGPMFCKEIPVEDIYGFFSSGIGFDDEFEFVVSGPEDEEYDFEEEPESIEDGISFVESDIDEQKMAEETYRRMKEIFDDTDLID